MSQYVVRFLQQVRASEPSGIGVLFGVRRSA